MSTILIILLILATIKYLRSDSIPKEYKDVSLRGITILNILVWGGLAICTWVANNL